MNGANDDDDDDDDDDEDNDDDDDDDDDEDDDDDDEDDDDEDDDAATAASMSRPCCGPMRLQLRPCLDHVAGRIVGVNRRATPRLSFWALRALLVNPNDRPHPLPLGGLLLGRRVLGLLLFSAATGSRDLLGLLLLGLLGLLLRALLGLLLHALHALHDLLLLHALHDFFVPVSAQGDQQVSSRRPHGAHASARARALRCPSEKI